MRASQATMDALTWSVEPALEALGDEWALAAFDAAWDALASLQGAYVGLLRSEDDSDWLAALQRARSTSAALVVALDAVGVEIPDPLVGTVASLAIYLDAVPEA